MGADNTFGETNFNPKTMKAQVNITNAHVPIFLEACQELQIIYHQIEERELDTRYEVTVENPSTLFYLGKGVGLRALITEILK